LACDRTGHKTIGWVIPAYRPPICRFLTRHIGAHEPIMVSWGATQASFSLIENRPLNPSTLFLDVIPRRYSSKTPLTKWKSIKKWRSARWPRFRMKISFACVFSALKPISAGQPAGHKTIAKFSIITTRCEVYLKRNSLRFSS